MPNAFAPILAHVVSSATVRSIENPSENVSIGVERFARRKSDNGIGIKTTGKKCADGNIAHQPVANGAFENAARFISSLIII